LEGGGSQKTGRLQRADRTEEATMRNVVTWGNAALAFLLALQLHILLGSESMGDHDSEPDDWWRID
jgi:hypothetical protein